MKILKLGLGISRWFFVGDGVPDPDGSVLLLETASDQLLLEGGTDAILLEGI